MCFDYLNYIKPIIMKQNSWINLHYALRLQNKITVKQLKTITNVIILYIIYIVTTCLIVTCFTSCASAEQKHYDNHVSYKTWSDYKKCSAYGNP